jgi:4-hydroxy-tetrahydrodipicolinate synthase
VRSQELPEEINMPKVRKFQGTATALVTPFKSDGSLDESALRKLVDLQIKGGVEALVAAGMTGESATLSKEEQRRVIELVLEQANRRVKVFAGASSNSTIEAILRTKAARDAGADAALVVGPYYNRPTQEGYFQHFAAIAEAVDIPLVVYNIPGRTGGNIEPSTLLRLAERIPSIEMVEEASGDMAQIMEFARNKPERCSLLSGVDSLALPLLVLGGDGCVSVVANQVPQEFSSMVRLCLRGDWEKARGAHNRLLPLMNANSLESDPIPVKTALACMGLIEESFRLPLLRMSPPDRVRMKEILQSLNLV